MRKAKEEPLSIKVCMHVLKQARTDVRVMREATALVEAGFAVSIVDIEDDCNQPVEEVIDGVCVKHIIVSRSFIAARFTRWALVKTLHILIRSTRRLMQTPADIYHAHDISGLPACYSAARLRRKPLIFDAHELPLAEFSSRLFFRVRTLLAYLLRRMVSYCAGVITVSPPIAQEIRKRYHASKVELIRNVPAYQATLKSDHLRQRLGLGPQARIALYQGNLTSSRGLDRLIHAAAFLERDIVILLMGQGYGKTQSQLEALIASEGVDDRVKILPPVPYAELLEWTASADIGLILYAPDYSLNVKMCLPNKLFEYLMAGLPVLATPLDAVSDIIGTYGVGQIVPSLDPEAMGAAINAMLADPAALARMRINALQASRDDLCWEKESQHLTRFYHDILLPRSGGEAQLSALDARWNSEASPVIDRTLTL